MNKRNEEWRKAVHINVKEIALSRQQWFLESQSRVIPALNCAAPVMMTMQEGKVGKIVNKTFFMI